MEKFGIFELLDTLSALLGDETDEGKTEEHSSAPTVTDTTFLPPDYTGGGEQDRGAISSFLTKHDETVKRITGKRE